MKDDDIWTLFLFQWEASCTKTEGLASDNRFFISKTSIWYVCKYFFHPAYISVRRFFLLEQSDDKHESWRSSYH